MTALSQGHPERHFFGWSVAEVTSPDDRPLRIWEIDSGAVMLALGVLLEPGELRGLLLQIGRTDASDSRDEVVLRESVSLCARRCPFAETVERLLEARTRRARHWAHGSPLAELAALWLGAQAEADGRQITALLWCLARDRRWLVRPLAEMVRGDLWVRALRLLATCRARAR